VRDRHALPDAGAEHPLPLAYRIPNDLKLRLDMLGTCHELHQLIKHGVLIPTDKWHLDARGRQELA
jgi:hypothetical protein